MVFMGKKAFLGYPNSNFHGIMVLLGEECNSFL
jgi:hypothetical protein